MRLRAGTSLWKCLMPSHPDFPPDPADFHFPPDLNDVTLDMMRQKVFLKRLNILDGDSDSE